MGKKSVMNHIQRSCHSCLVCQNNRKKIIFFFSHKTKCLNIQSSSKTVNLKKLKGPVENIAVTGQNLIIKTTTLVAVVHLLIY